MFIRVVDKLTDKKSIILIEKTHFYINHKGKRMYVHPKDIADKDLMWIFNKYLRQRSLPPKIKKENNKITFYIPYNEDFYYKINIHKDNIYVFVVDYSEIKDKINIDQFWKRLKRMLNHYGIILIEIYNRL